MASTSGTPDAPIWLCGSRDAVLDCPVVADLGELLALID